RTTAAELINGEFLPNGRFAAIRGGFAGLDGPSRNPRRRNGPTHPNVKLLQSTGFDAHEVRPATLLAIEACRPHATLLGVEQADRFVQFAEAIRSEPAPAVGVADHEHS